MAEWYSYLNYLLQAFFGHLRDCHITMRHLVLFFFLQQ